MLGAPPDPTGCTQHPPCSPHCLEKKKIAASVKHRVPRVPFQHPTIFSTGNFLSRMLSLSK